MIDKGYSRYETDKTRQEIHDAYMSGSIVYIHFPDDAYEYYTNQYFNMLGIEESPHNGSYNIYIFYPPNTGSYISLGANSPDEYPGTTFD